MGDKPARALDAGASPTHLPPGIEAGRLCLGHRRRSEPEGLWAGSSRTRWVGPVDNPRQTTEQRSLPCWQGNRDPGRARPCDTISPLMCSNGNATTTSAARLATLAPGQSLSPDAVLRALARVAPEASEFDKSSGDALYLAPEDLGWWPESRDPGLREWRRFLAPAIEGPGGDALLKSDTGLAVFRVGERGLAIVPPFPIGETVAREEWDEGPLRQLLTTDYTVGVVLLRLGRYLVAVFQGTEPVVTKTDTRYVKGKHHAGGTSQLRFKRIREGQMRKLFDEACGVVSDRFQPHERELDYILLGGERLTLSGFLKVCPYLQRRQDIILDRRLNIRDPKHDTLETVAGLLRQSRVWAIVP